MLCRSDLKRLINVFFWFSPKERNPVIRSKRSHIFVLWIFTWCVQLRYEDVICVICLRLWWRLNEICELLFQSGFVNWNNWFTVKIRQMILSWNQTLLLISRKCFQWISLNLFLKPLCFCIPFEHWNPFYPICIEMQVNPNCSRKTGQTRHSQSSTLAKTSAHYSRTQMQTTYFIFFFIWPSLYQSSADWLDQKYRKVKPFLLSDQGF